MRHASKVALAAALAPISAPLAGPQGLPPGFQDVGLPALFDQPTALAFAADGIPDECP